ncbi:E3 ubiquitin-protein ligase Mdm2-like isoform X2 [Aphidius gifuensis]|uniref:E3 ubiquitin-protein ligase Mdm2-like isoform X2 n=1 Tax=Aphidius gifuensis TaxID=684658 RepID=UPI001CDBA884|nr:E3 ubiquitin-protein ligase Mdm2-like isoform X2 [Aphidius gifuensis]
MSLTISPLKQANVSLNPGVWKRSNSSSDDDNHHENGNSYKKTRLSYCYNVILESESSQPSDLDSDNESIYSLQGQETEYARDTSDTSTSPGTWITLSGTNYQSMDYEPDSESESEDGMLITAREYEPVSESDTGNDENPLIFTSSSENEEYIAPNVIFEIFQSDTEYADNSDDSRTSYDSEISHTDYWKCIQCNATQNNPLFRYCEKCYKLRKSYFTPRPKAKGKRDKTDNKNKIKNDNKKDKSETILSQGSTVDSGVASNASQESQSSSIGPYNNIDNSINNLTESMISSPSSSSLSILSSSVIKNDGVDNVDSVDTVDTVDSVGNNESVDFDAVKNVCKMKRSVSTLSEGSISGQSVINSSQNSNENDKNCMICTVAPRDGAFAHEKKKME